MDHRPRPDLAPHQRSEMRQSSGRRNRGFAARRSWCNLSPGARRLGPEQWESLADDAVTFAQWNVLQPIVKDAALRQPAHVITQKSHAEGPSRVGGSTSQRGVQDPRVEKNHIARADIEHAYRKAGGFCLDVRQAAPIEKGGGGCHVPL